MDHPDLTISNFMENSIGFKRVNYQNLVCRLRERSGSVVECLTQDWGAAGSSLTGITVLCPEQEH